MAHLVTCTICQRKFDRDAESAVAVSTKRYAHKECYEKEMQQKTEKEALEEYIKKKYHMSYVSPNIQKQIKDYRNNYNFSYVGILRALVYWYEVKGNQIKEDFDNTIGIVPYIINEAESYYRRIAIAKLANQNSSFEKIKQQYVEIPSPRTETKKIKLFNLDD